MGGSRAKNRRSNQFLARPNARDWIHSIGQGLAECDDVRLDIEMLHCPHLAGSVKTHLDLIVDNQYASLLADRGHSLEVTRRRDDVAPSPLYGFHEEATEFGPA